MTKVIVVLTTTGELREARKLARRLVDSRLAACVNISSPVRSLYRWQGKTVDEREYVILIKTRRDRFRELSEAILEMHSYTTPEIIALPVSAGSQDYLSWIGDSVAPAR
ncbi:MAG: divalent-cation tolerance protein CutA [Terriglobia bacterium]